MNRQQKQEVIDRLTTTFSEAPSLVLTGFKGLTVAQIDEVRRGLEAAGAQFEVVKNTLARKALSNSGMDGLASSFKENTAVAYHREDPVAAAKILVELAKTNQNLVLKAGWLDGKVLDEKGVEALSKLPGKDELRAKLLSLFVAVPTNMVRVLNGVSTKFARVLQARADQLNEG